MKRLVNNPTKLNPNLDLLICAATPILSVIVPDLLRALETNFETTAAGIATIFRHHRYYSLL